METQTMNLDIEYYYKKYSPMVYRRCKQLLYDHDMAKDAMQEVFVQLIQKQSAITMEYPSSLLYRIASNISLNMIRAQKRRVEVSHDDDLVQKIVMDDSIASVMDAQSLLTKIFKREKPSTKLIALYHFVDGMSLEQTAKEVKMSVSGVRKRLRLLKRSSQLDNTGINN